MGDETNSISNDNIFKTAVETSDEISDEKPDSPSPTYPMEAGQIRVGGHILIKNRPCKVSAVSTSKTGKHGHAKCNFTAIDIFTGKKREDIIPSTHNVDVPNVKRIEYQLIDITDDELSLMDENGNEITKKYTLIDINNDDITKKYTFIDITLVGKIKDAFELGKYAFELGKDIFVTVLSAMDNEKIISFIEK